MCVKCNIQIMYSNNTTRTILKSKVAQIYRTSPLSLLLSLYEIDSKPSYDKFHPALKVLIFLVIFGIDN